MSNALKAHVEDGRVVLDEPMDLPNGTPLTVSIGNDAEVFVDMDPEERVALEAAFEEGYEDFEKGEYEDARPYAESLLAKT